MSIYPFYIRSKVPNRVSPIEGGCRSQEGEQTTEILQRENGKPKEIFSIHQYTEKVDGKLMCVCRITDKDTGEVIAIKKTFY